MRGKHASTTTRRIGTNPGFLIAATIIILTAVIVALPFTLSGCAAQPASSASTAASSSASVSDKSAGSTAESGSTTTTPSRLRAAVPDLDLETAEETTTWLVDCGFDAVWVGRTETVDPADYDCLVVPGGTADVTPSLYGRERDEKTKECDLEFDNFEIDLCKKFADAGKPVLGICRGAQVLNVAFGGTLEQHIPGWHTKNRDITVNKQSLLYDLFGSEETVYHYHHQCVDDLAEGFIATQFDAEDGRIEAFRHETLPIYALQWHPDSMDERGKEVMDVFRDLCYENMKKGASTSSSSSSKAA